MKKSLTLFLLFVLTACTTAHKAKLDTTGSQGEPGSLPVVELSVENYYPDGIAALDLDTFLLAEYGTNRLTMIDVVGNSGTKQIIGTGLDFPTNVTVVADGAWVVESQINHMLYPDTAGSSQIPFLLKHMSLPSH